MGKTSTRFIKVFTYQIEKPIFYIFSDDQEWSENLIKKLGVDYFMVSSNKGKDSYKDMYLMTRCRHNVIANSTFSWWGAWLNENKDKIVVSPNKWTITINMDYRLPNWVYIEV